MTTLFRIERLRVPADRRWGLKHWGGRDVRHAADLVRQQTIGSGCTLPPAVISGGIVCAVVEWDDDILAGRFSKQQWPVLYRNVLYDRIEHNRGCLEPSPLRVLGYICIGRLQTSRSTLARLSGMSRAIAAVPERPQMDSWDAMECDYYGHTVATVNTDDVVTVVVDGLPAGKGEHRDLGRHYFRLREEQLFDVALRTGATPLDSATAP